MAWLKSLYTGRCWNHNPRVGGSNPSAATITKGDPGLFSDPLVLSVSFRRIKGLSYLASLLLSATGIHRGARVEVFVHVAGAKAGNSGLFLSYSVSFRLQEGSFSAALC